MGIELLGVNEAGFESANDQMCDGRDIPWLQDTEAAAWWTSWGVVYRDVLILDANGALAEVYNLTNQPITDDANYVELKSLLIDIAQAQP